MLSPFVAAAEEVAGPVVPTETITQPRAPSSRDVASSTGDRGETAVAGSAGGSGDGSSGGGTGADVLIPAAPAAADLEGGDVAGGIPSGGAAAEPGALISGVPASSPAPGGAEIVQPPFAASPFAAPASAPAPLDGTAAAAAPTSDGPSALDVVAATATDPSVLAAATGVAVLVGAGIAGSRLGCAAEARLLFTNVRLLPCLVRNSVSEHLAPLTSALPSSGPAGPAAVLQPAVAVEGAALGTSVVNDPPPDAVQRDEARTGFLGSFANGFEQAIRGETREIGDSLGDSRLMIQLGMALGFVYAAFLSVWFWATRLRRRPGS